MNDSAFTSLNLPAAQIQNLNDLGYSRMTPIQAQSLPLVLKGKDLIAKAKTGSGKTATFGIGLLEKLNVRSFACQALVMCPTRELAGQVAKELRKLARYQHNVKILTLCGGMPIGPQIGSLAHGTHIVVGTPGRIQDHLRKGTLDLGRVNTVVLDEADRMLDMGFAESMEAILQETPA
ncbi:DEAD/DEAH box helicase, partial [Oceanospirillum sp. HFRX-1_2]